MCRHQFCWITCEGVNNASQTEVSATLTRKRKRNHQEKTLKCEVFNLKQLIQLFHFTGVLCYTPPLRRDEGSLKENNEDTLGNTTHKKNRKKWGCIVQRRKIWRKWRLHSLNMWKIIMKRAVVDFLLHPCSASGEQARRWDYSRRNTACLCCKCNRAIKYLRALI